ncbi:MAG: type II secretion system F family protein [Candidatus Kerfeldbacteria bacterium]
MEFQYIATTKEGKLKNGVVDTSSKEKAHEYLQQKGLKVVSIHNKGKHKNKRANFLDANIGKGKATLMDKVIIARHLAVMLRAGLPLVEALKAIEEQSTSNKIKIIISKVRADVSGGNNLASSLTKFPKVFSGIFIGMVKVGEASGTLERNLEYVAGELEKDYELTRKVKSALLYPIIVITATFILGIGLTIFILPKIVDMFDTFKLELPITTKIFLGVATFLVDYGIYVLIFVILSVIVVRVLMKLEKTKKYFHRLYLKIPVAKAIVRNLNLARMTRSLSILLKSGVTINDSLEIAVVAVENTEFKDILNNSLKGVKRGQPLAVTMGSRPEIIPSMVNKMIAIGEKTGKLEESLFYLADFYEEEVNNATKNLATVIEPILLIFIGLVLGFLSVAIISPIYQFTGSLQR